MTHFVLVHGAWHDAWCWERVIPALLERGHSVSAVGLQILRGRVPKPALRQSKSPVYYSRLRCGGSFRGRPNRPSRGAAGPGGRTGASSRTDACSGA
jgi:hypothetical protein